MIGRSEEEIGLRLEQDVRALASIERPSASPGEEAAARWVQSRLRDLGLEAEVEQFQFNPDYWSVWGLHGLLAALSAALGRLGSGKARVGALTGALAAASFWGDVTTEFYLLRRLFPTRASYNVLARLPNPDATRVLIVSAHHDAARSGLVFHPLLYRLMARVQKEPSPPPLHLPLFTMLMISVGGALRGIGVQGRVLRWSLTAGALVNLTFAALMRNVGRSGVSPGANDDASGVAVLLALAQGLSREPPSRLEVWFLSTGSEEGILGGMAAFLERHRAELDGRKPFVLNLEMMGSGHPVFFEGEGFLRRYQYDRHAVNLAREVATETEFRDVRSLGLAPFASDALAATRAGIPAITVASLNDAGYVPHYHWTSDIAENVDLHSVARAYAFCRCLIARLAESAEAKGSQPGGGS